MEAIEGSNIVNYWGGSAAARILEGQRVRNKSGYKNGNTQADGYVMSRMVDLKEEYPSCIGTVAVAVSMPGTCNAIQIVRSDILIYKKMYCEPRWVKQIGHRKTAQHWIIRQILLRFNSVQEIRKE